MLNIDIVKDAQKVLEGVARKTEIIQTRNIVNNSTVYLKAENLQNTGSFKVRGAYYKMSKLTAEEKSKGVVACSAGNHAQGVALAAQKSNVKAVICLPSGAPLTKIEATRQYGAEVCLVEGVYDDAYNKALSLKEEKGYTFVHPFNDEYVIAGQGTIGLEILEQLPDVDAVIVPIGGGGLISGIAYAIKSINPNVKVYGVQSSGAPSMFNSIKGKKIEELHSVHTIADGIAVKKPGDLTYELCSKYVDDIVTVSDDEISAAILALIEKQKMIAEGAGAVSLAAVMFNKLPLESKKVCCVISGGNIDVNILSRVIKRGQLITGRTCQLLLELLDKPGQLSKVCEVIASLGGNVISVQHERTIERTEINGCYLRVELETKDFNHIEEIKTRLLEEGIKVL